MKWKGRRQSVDIIDLKSSPKTVSAAWFNGSNYSSGAVIIDTDGTIYVDSNEVTIGEISAMSENFEIICVPVPEPIDEDNPPSLTTSQKIAIAMLIGEISKTTNSGKVTVKEPSSYLEVQISEYVQSLLNNG